MREIKRIPYKVLGKYEYKTVNLNWCSDHDNIVLGNLYDQGWEPHTYLADNPSHIVDIRRVIKPNPQA